MMFNRLHRDVKVSLAIDALKHFLHNLFISYHFSPLYNPAPTDHRTGSDTGLQPDFVPPGLL